jgi:hypothetical protein
MKQRKNPKGGPGWGGGRIIDLCVWMWGWLSISRGKLGLRG